MMDVRFDEKPLPYTQQEERAFEEIAIKIDRYIDEDKTKSCEFTYYDCSWTVEDIENNRYCLYYIRLFQEVIGDDKIVYHIYFKRVNGCHFDGLKFFECIRSLFYETEDFPDNSKNIFDTSVDMDNVFKEFLDLDRPDDKTIENRANEAWEKLKELDDSKNKEFVKYEKSEVIKTIVDLSINDKAKQYFTPDVLSLLLVYLISIDSNYDLTLTATRCVIIFYNILLTEKTTLDVIDPLLDYCLGIAKTPGNVYDEQMRLKACQIIKIIANGDYNITDVRKNQMNEFLEWLNNKNIFVNKL
jgi:hypothetical protein